MGKQRKTSGKNLHREKAAISNSVSSESASGSKHQSRTSSRSPSKAEKSVSRKREANPLDSIPKFEKFHRKPRRDADSSPMPIVSVHSTPKTARRQKSTNKKAEQQPIENELEAMVSPAKVTSPMKEQSKANSNSKRAVKSEKQQSAAKSEEEAADDLNMMLAVQSNADRHEPPTAPYRPPVHSALNLSALTEEADVEREERPVSPRKDITSNKKSTPRSNNKNETGNNDASNSKNLIPVVHKMSEGVNSQAIQQPLFNQQSEHIYSETDKSKIHNELDSHVQFKSASKEKVDLPVSKTTEKKQQQSESSRPESKRNSALKLPQASSALTSELTDSQPQIALADNREVQKSTLKLGNQPSVLTTPTAPLHENIKSTEQLHGASGKKADIENDGDNKNGNRSESSIESKVSSSRSSSEQEGEGHQLNSRDTKLKSSAEAREASGSKGNTAQGGKFVLEPLVKEGTHALFTNRPYDETPFENTRRSRNETPDKAFNEPSLDAQKPGFASNSKQNNDGTEFTFY